jgi:hypothetical protein
MKTGLVVHEVLHWYGLSHNTTDRGSIMSPMEHQRPDPSEWFGPSDLAAIKKISDWRGC